jgi:PAS domain S-box-containing protein
MDNTNKQIEKAYDEWLAALDAVEYPIFIHDKEFRILRCNRAYQQYAGRPFKEIIGRPYYEFFPKNDGPMRHCSEALEYPSDKGSEEEFRVDEKIFYSRGVIINDDQGNYLYSLHILKDITEEKYHEDKLRKSEEQYRTLFETMLNGLAYCQMVYEEGLPVDFIYLDVNKAFEEQTGLKNVIGKRISEVIPGIRELDPELFERYAKVASGGKPEQFEIYVKSLEMWFFISVYNPKPEHFVAIFDVITERKKAEEALKNEAIRRRILMESSRDGIAIINQDYKIIEANACFSGMIGYTPEETLNLHVWDFEALMSEEDVRKSFADVASVNTTIETRHRRKNGTIYDAEVSISGSVVNNEPMTFTIIRDITERKKTQTSLSRANRALKMLSAVNIALVHAENENTLLQAVTNIIVKQAGYSLSVVVYADDNARKSITPMAGAGMEENSYYWVEQITWDDTENGQLPVSLAIRSGETQVCRNISCTIGFKPWKETALTQGYTANIALPLSDGKKTFGALCIYSSEENAFEEDEIQLLEELANDLAYGIINLRTRVEHEQHAILLRQSMAQSIQAIAATVEARDPYTAGHQERVGELATAIAQEMGLSEEQIQGIHFAAIIHDLGKIHIPSEILSKPGKLSDIEFMLIQTHPQAGYNILKDIKFPWPIADIILQHHEKLDGSGYPQGLKEKQILLEAKIVCVADVVEAMSSHRPYRSGLGIEKALNEIKRGRGIEYDPSVVDACLKLFAKKEFAFGSESL